MPTNQTFQSLITDRLPSWTPRLGFTVLLLTFGEFVAWHQSSTYSLLDWLAVATIYLALTMITLDLIARFQIHDWIGILLIGGIFGIAHSALISLTFYHNIPINIVLHATGLQTLMFMLTYAAFQFLYTNTIPPQPLFIITPILGLGYGISLKWLPHLDSINLPVPELGAALPYTIIALIASALIIFIMRLPAEIKRFDWMLLPMEWVFSGGVIFVTALLRFNGGYIDSPFAFTIALVILAMILLLLWFIHSTQPKQKIEWGIKLAPHQQTIIYWVTMFLPFALAAWLGYQLPGDGKYSLQGTLLFGALIAFGILWLPIVSTLISIRAFSEMGRQQY
jgi:hypothetical protein